VLFCHFVITWALLWKAHFSLYLIVHYSTGRRKGATKQIFSCT